jgi:hypothetical protein
MQAFGFLKGHWRGTCEKPGLTIEKGIKDKWEGRVLGETSKTHTTRSSKFKNNNHRNHCFKEGAAQMQAFSFLKKALGH